MGKLQACGPEIARGFFNLADQTSSQNCPDKNKILISFCLYPALPSFLVEPLEGALQTQLAITVVQICTTSPEWAKVDSQ